MAREGFIPTLLGVAVTTGGIVMQRRDIFPRIATGVIGFGLAHIAIGSIDLIQGK